MRPAATPVQEKPTILVVDDTPDNLTLLSGLFKEDYRVRIAHHCKEALSIAQSDTLPDLILLDIMMLGIDGFEVAQQLRAPRPPSTFRSSSSPR
jgi:CheY-like chemotaxis protein